MKNLKNEAIEFGYYIKTNGKTRYFKAELATESLNEKTKSGSRKKAKFQPTADNKIILPYSTNYIDVDEALKTESKTKAKK